MGSGQPDTDLGRIAEALYLGGKGMPIFKSGAFLQQCFSVHPLSLCLKLVELPETVGVLCVNCRMRHRLTIRSSAQTPMEQARLEVVDLTALNQCFHVHPEEIRLTAVAVEQETIQFRCRPCHKIFSLTVDLFETYQSS